MKTNKILLLIAAVVLLCSCSGRGTKVQESREYARLYEKTYLEALKEKIDERIDVIEQCNNSMLKLSEPNKTE